jgi:hypothetical protein
MRKPPAPMPLLDVVLYAVVGVTLTYFFHDPIANYVTEAVRPAIARALGEPEPKSHSVRWHVEQP